MRYSLPTRNIATVILLVITFVSVLAVEIVMAGSMVGAQLGAISAASELSQAKKAQAQIYYSTLEGARVRHDAAP